ncbi:two-component regulator propeller domain-containing protein [Shewanella litorisediminis]|uniref:histidine kinase n=1 Tax=Shewanella litorisediminis TaxID=1173586 RepID=A0ABX7G6B5_9GAMM|nr:two-component regulator propeller domain-containing protein [Shewanella litorisediminis]MCL2917610.1 ATP-binding protein [Shewanella litorisediminis]QRH02735.1 PAS domain-containing protein [Shewanella litorisediminis]
MKLILSSLILLCGSLLCAGAFGYKPAFQTLEAEHGLSMNTVNDLVTDSRGYLWIATQAGLNRYDGKHFKIYTQSDAPNGPSANDISFLHLSAKGELWLLTENAGVNLYAPLTDTFTVFGTEAGIPNVRFTGISEDPSGNLWLATDKQGVLEFSPSAGRVVKTHSIQGRSNVLGITADGRGGFWLAMLGGVSHLTKDGVSTSPDRLRGLSVSAMATDPAGNLWLGTDDMALLRYRPQEDLLEDYSSLFPADITRVAIADLLFDVRSHSDHRHGAALASTTASAAPEDLGHLWISTAGAGLAELETGTGRLLRYEHSPSDYRSLSNQTLTRLWLDEEQQLWIGTRSAGIARLSLPSRQLRHIHGQSFDKANLQNTDIRSFFRDSQGQLWVGSTGGLLRANESAEGEIQGFLPHALPLPELTHAFISFISEDDGGRLWIGTRGLGLVIVSEDRQSFRQFRHEPGNSASLPSNTLYSLFRDADRQFWITTLDGGVARMEMDTGRFSAIDRSNTNILPEDQVTGMAQSKDGTLWIATYGGGLAMLDTQGQYRHFNTDSTPALPSNHLFSIYMEDDGKLWLASDNGVFSLNTQTMAVDRIDKSRGLIGDVVYLMILDNNHRLWAGTASGLSVIDTRTGNIRSFTKEDGLQDNEFNFGAAFLDRDNSLFLGGINGFNHIHPEDLPRRTPPRAPTIQSLMLMNQPAKLPPSSVNTGERTSLSISHTDSLFALGYQSAALTDAHQLSYEYRMLGLDDNWFNDSNLQQATFTGLSPGLYQFEVRARNIDGAQSPITAMRIHIEAAPWQTWWAYGLYLLMATGILGLLLYMKLSKYRAKMALMDKIALSEQRLQQALYSSGDEFWDWEIAAQRLTRSNTYLSYPAQEQNLANTLLAVIHPDDVAKAREVMDDCLYQGADEFEVSYRGRTGADQWLWVLNHGKVISRDATGRPERIMGTIKNIQRLKEAEEALRQLNAELEQRVTVRTQELQAKNEELNTLLEELRQTRDELLDKEKMATLGGLVASITHEVNTPIGISVTAASHLQDRVKGFTAAFEKGEVDEDDFVLYQSEVNDCCKLMLTNLERAAKLISSFKKVSVDQSHEELREFDLSQYVDEIFLSLNPLLSRTPHKYSYECDPKLLINSNPGIFYQIISNLFNNSIIHAYPDGRSGTLQLTIKRTPEGIVLDYRDDGCGMSQEIQDNIFTPFFTTKRGKGGSGLGMNIVYNLVHQVLEGDIELITAPNQGAHFIIRLPKSMELPLPH